MMTLPSGQSSSAARPTGVKFGRIPKLTEHKQAEVPQSPRRRRELPIDRSGDGRASCRDRQVGGVEGGSHVRA